MYTSYYEIMSKSEQNTLIKHADGIARQIESHKVKSEASIYGLAPFISIYETGEKFCDLVSNIDVNNLADSAYRDKAFREASNAFVLFCEMTEFSKNLGLSIKSTLSELKICCDKMCTIGDNVELKNDEINNNNEGELDEVDNNDVEATLKSKKPLVKKGKQSEGEKVEKVEKVETVTSNESTTTTPSVTKDVKKTPAKKTVAQKKVETKKVEEISEGTTTITPSVTKDVKKTPVKKTAAPKKAEIKKDEEVIEETKETIEPKNDVKSKTTTSTSKAKTAPQSESHSVSTKKPVVTTSTSTGVPTPAASNKKTNTTKAKPTK